MLPTGVITRGERLLLVPMHASRVTVAIQMLINTAAIKGPVL
jgi:hypothetical protein